MERNFDILGTLSHYNGILFGDLIAEQADSEGALAVGGNAALGSPGHGYDVGTAGVPGWESVVIGNYQNPEGYPSFLLGGVIAPGSTSVRIYGGPTVLKNSYQQQYESGSFRFETTELRYVDDADINAFFGFAKDKFIHTGGVLFGGSAKRITPGDLGSLNTLNQADYLSENIESDKKILIYTLDCGDEITIGDIGLGHYINDYDMIIINAPAKKVTFKNGAILYDESIVNTSIPRIYEGNLLIALLASKIVFNFPEAEEILMENYGIIGSVISSLAAVSGMGGSINGTLVAGSLNQRNGMELHAFTLPLGEELLSLESIVQSITIEKTDADSLAGIYGTRFTLYEYDAETKITGEIVSSGVTDEQGRLTFSELVPQCYLLEETAPAPGYRLPEEHTWIIDLSLYKELYKMEIIHISNTRAKYEVKFIKSDLDDETIKLSGAEFSLYIYNPQDSRYDLLKAGLTTNSAGILVIPELLPGKYRLLETGAPDGYYLPEDYATDFEIDLDGNIDAAEDEYINIYNQRLAVIHLVKHDHENPERLLAGAVFSLYRYNADSEDFELLSAGHTTGREGEFTVGGLLPGSYKLIETAAPAGYYLDDSNEIRFDIVLDADKRILPVPTLNAFNKMLGKVQIYKVDSADNEIFLAGAEFTLYNRVGETYEEYRTGLVSDSSGSLLIESLQPGEYKLVETKAPAGYLLPENPETAFTVTI